MHPFAFVGALLQRFVPHQLCARWMYALARSRRPWLKRLLIRGFTLRYQIDMSEAAEPDPSAYPDFNSLFVRALKPGARPFPALEGRVGSPVDGTVGAFGDIDGNTLLQAKGRRYTLQALFAGRQHFAQAFEGGSYCTLYLAPHQYHRVHMPVDGTLRALLHVPGRLFSVREATVRHVARLYARNERVINLFYSEAGLMAVVMVGAFGVSSIETSWEGEINPREYRDDLISVNYPLPDQDPIRLEQGDELGRFNLGSTVLLLFARGAARWHPQLAEGQAMRVGQEIGALLPRHA